MALTQIDDRGLKTPIDLLDNENIRLGTGNDLKLYHDGSESVILSETGGLQIKDTGGYMRIRSNELKIQSEANETYIEADANGAVQLFYDNSKKLETTSSGVTVTGTLEATTYVAVPDQIYHVGDADTTIRFPAADTIALETAGSERLRVDGSGRVGIGTNNPSNLLHCATSDTTVARFESTASGGTGVELLLHHNSSSPADGDNIGAIYFQADDDAGNKSTFGTILVNAEDVSNGSEDGHIRFETASNGTVSERMRIASDGKIGIGLTNPVNNLDVSGSVSATGNMLNTAYADGVYIGTNGGLPAITAGKASNSAYAPLVFRQDNTAAGAERMRIDTNGNVGIGTSTPTASNAAYNSATLHLHQTGSSSAGSQVHLTTGASGQGIADGSILAQYSDNHLYINNQEDGAIRFFTNNGERGRIDADGLKFNSDTAAANALDDYETGTWTVNTSVSSPSQVYSASYVKIGDSVTVTAYIVCPSSSDTNNFQITSLPFTSKGSAHYWIGAAYSQVHTSNNFFVQVNPGNNDIYTYERVGNTVTYANLSGMYLLFTCTYFTA